jgi:hypothetical protein
MSAFMAVIAADMVSIWASRSARVGSVMVADCVVEEAGDGGGWVRAATAAFDWSEVEAEDHRNPDTRVSRAW